MISRKKIKLLTIVGARPQFIKAAMFSHCLIDLKFKDQFSEVMVHTGQHYDANMSKIFFDSLNIPKPQYILNINNLNHGKMTGEMLIKLEDIIIAEQPSAVVVFGDTNSTLAGALVASKLHIPVIHIEAGVRSFNKAMPEELNRIMTDHVSSMLFCPTANAVTNLAKENIVTNVWCVGDIMQDLMPHVQQYEFNHDLLNQFTLTKKEYLLLTLHRAENTDDQSRLIDLLKYVEYFAQQEQLKIIFPIHPRTRKICNQYKIDLDAFQLIEPLGYFDIQNLIQHARYVFTDSGGLQKEAYYHRVPCVTLREETEWVETIDCGWNRLWQSTEYKSQQEIIEYNSAQKVADKILTIISNELIKNQALA